MADFDPSRMTFTQVLERCALAAGSKVALRIKRGDSWQELTYAGLRHAAQALARTLVAEGHAVGDRVLLYAESQPEWVVAYFGAVAAGLAVVPLDPQTPAEEVLWLAKFTEARLLFVSDMTAGVFSPKRGTVPPIPVRNIATLAHEDPTPTDEIIDRAEPSHPASIIFVAGTKIDPRGAILTHRNILSNVASVSQVLQPKPDDRFLSVLPLNHVFEFSSGLLAPISVGATVTYAGSLNPRTILATLDKIEATVVLGMPRLFQMFAELARRRARNGDRSAEAILREMFGDAIRVLVSGGAALDPDVYAIYERAGIPIHEGYGLTEASPVVTVNPLYQTRQGSVGKPVPGVEIQLVNTDADGIGELLARGPSIMAGYFRNPQATEQVLRDGWLYTGDLGFRDEDGYYFITGRTKDIIVTSAGKNVHPAEVERVYSGLPRVHDICVVGMRDEHKREEVHAVLVVSDEIAESKTLRREIQRAIQAINASIPSYQRVQQVHYWTRPLPTAETPKARRDEVIRLLAVGEDEIEASPAEGPTEVTPWKPKPWQKELIQEIAQIAGIDPSRIRPGLAFDQDLHLDSLMKVELLAMVETRLKLSLPEHIALRFQTVQDVIDYLAPRLDDAAAALTAEETSHVALDALPASEYETQYVLKSRVQNLLGATFRLGLRALYRGVFSLQGFGMEYLPTEGPFIIAANHSSHLDSGAIISLMGRRARHLHVLGAKDYFFDSDLKGWAVSTLLNVIPFDRHENFLASLGLSQRAVEMGRSLLIFPEGTRSRTGEIGEFKPGLGLLALELGVPIVPAFIAGTYAALPPGRSLPKRGRIEVHFGPPIEMDPYLARRKKEARYPLYREITERVQAAVEALRQRHRTT